MPATVFNPATEGMGIGLVGLGDPNVVINRQFRFTLEILSNSTACSFRIPPYFVKNVQFPQNTIENTTLDFLNSKLFLPGKLTWEPVTVTYIDVAGNLSGNAAGSNAALYQWLVTIFNFTSPTKQYMATKRSDYTSTAVLSKWDGCGTLTSQWVLLDAWPESMNFGSGDYSSSETLDIELSLRYSQVSYTSYCPAFTLQNCCSSCT